MKAAQKREAGEVHNGAVPVLRVPADHGEHNEHLRLQVRKENRFLTLKPDNSLACKQTMCLNCCNNMEKILKFVAQTRIGSVFKVANDGEWKRVLKNTF